MKKLIASSIFGLSLVASSARAEIRIGGTDEVQNRLNINIPTDQVTVEQAQQLLGLFSSSIVEGKTEIVLADELAKIDIPAEFKALVDKVVASRDPSAFVECAGRSCKITSSGKALDFKVDGVSLPVLGTPSISLGQSIEIYTRVSDDSQRAEICKIVGVAVKVGILKPALDGALIEIADGKIKTLLVDAGSGGSYPTHDCDFVAESSQQTNESTSPVEATQATAAPHSVSAAN